MLIHKCWNVRPEPYFAGKFPVKNAGKAPQYISSGQNDGEFLLSSAKSVDSGLVGFTVLVDANGNLTGGVKGVGAKLDPAATTPDWLQKKFQQDIQRSAGNVVVEYTAAGDSVAKEYALVADYNFLINDSHYGNSDMLGKQIGGKIGIIQDPFGTPVYIGATIPIPGVALNQLMLDPNGFLYATAMVDDNSHRYSSGEMMYNSLFVWNTGKLIQTALDARQRSGDLSVPISELPTRYDTPKSDSTPSNPQLFGWIYGQGAYSAQNVPKVYLHQVPALQSLAPSIYDSSKTANPKVPTPPVKDTSNGTWNTFMILAGAEVTQLTSFLSASVQSLFGMDNSATLAKMTEAQQVMNTIGFDINAGGPLDQLGAIAAQITNSAFAGLTQVSMNATGYYLRGLAGIVESVSPGTIAPLPAPTPFLQMVDSGASIGEQINYVTTAFIQGTVSGGLALLKMPADMIMGNWSDAKEHGIEALEMLIGFKGGEYALGKTKLALKIKQLAFDIQRMGQGIISKSPLEMLKKGADGKQLMIKEKTIPSNDPTVPPVKVPDILTPEQVKQETAGTLHMAPNGQVVKVPVCFGAKTLVHTISGCLPIEWIGVGTQVLTRNEVTGEQGYRKVVRAMERRVKQVYLVRFVTDGHTDVLHTDILSVTPEHPFWVNGIGWVKAGNLQAGQELEICDPDWREPVDRPGGREGALAQKLSGGRWTAKVVSVMPDEHEHERTVYNFEVEDFHTYFVGPFGVWVHNKSMVVTATLQKLTPDNLPKAVKYKREPAINDSQEVINGIIGENQAADFLAQHNLDIVYLPPGTGNTLGKGTGRPDILINGRTADIYTPQTPSVPGDLTTIWRTIAEDKTINQSSDIVLNLEQAAGVTVQDIFNLIEQKQIPTLAHLYIIKDGVATFREYPSTGQNAPVNAPVYGQVLFKSGMTEVLSGSTSGLDYKRLEVVSEGDATDISLLTMADINTLLPIARQYWLTAGASASVLDATQITIGDLPAGVAGQIQGNQITLSANGAGWGWFVDSTPALSEEFTLQANATLQANPDTAANGKLDLLTVMIHELGHRLGLVHNSNCAMGRSRTGARHTPSDLGQTVGRTAIPDQSHPVRHRRECHPHQRQPQRCRRLEYPRQRGHRLRCRNAQRSRHPSNASKPSVTRLRLNMN